MAGEGVVARPAEARVSTGNPSLDAMLEGGLVAHRPYLIVGASGTGKTTLGVQFLCEGVRRNERVLLVTLEEPPNEARVNHRGLEPALGRVEVFDAIPDIMRYERAPFKDIASVRMAVPFARVPFRIRHSPELASVEVTITALEQMLRTEVIRRGYTRLVIDSLTALQYFCMKGFDPVAGAQSFLRFLSDLRVTTLLTVEAPLEDIETPERMLARGEIRLFRWELDGQTVRAIGVEKFRGSSHDIRLHPYRIGPQGIDINLEVTISRDTRQIIEPIVPRVAVPVAAAPTAPLVSPVTPLIDEVRDLILLGADVAPARSEIAAALEATTEGHPDQAQAHLSRVSSLVTVMVDHLSRAPAPQAPSDPTTVATLQRVLARADTVRTGVPPTSLPSPSVLAVQLGALLSLLPPPAVVPAEAPAPPPSPVPSAAPSPRPAPVLAEASPTPTAVGVGPSPVPTETLPPSPAAEPSPPAPAVEPTPPAEAAEGKTLEPVVTPSEGEAPSPEPVGEPAAAPVPAEVAAPSAPVSSATPAPGLQEKASPPPSPPTPAPVAEVATVPEPVVAPRPHAVRNLPPPPKPRPPAAGPRVSKPTLAPPPRSGGTKASPPPLPRTTVPTWPPVPSPSAPTPAMPPGMTHAAEAHAPGTAAPARTPTAAPSKKRRKAGTTAAAKRTATHGRTAAPHAGEGKVEAAPEAVRAAPSPPPPPHPVATAALPEAPVAPKPRRRTARKRKAPPVVSATVEPTPPGALEETSPEPKSTDDPDPPTAPEG